MSISLAQEFPHNIFRMADTDTSGQLSPSKFSRSYIMTTRSMIFLDASLISLLLEIVFIDLMFAYDLKVMFLYIDVPRFKFG